MISYNKKFMTNQSSTKTQEIVRKIDELIKRNKVSWIEVFKELEKRKTFPRKKFEKKDIWEEVKGMWSKKKIVERTAGMLGKSFPSGIAYERKIRKEWEKRLERELGL